MIRTLLKSAGIAVIGAGIFVSCLEELENIDKISGSAFEPIVDFPLINSNFTMADFLTEGQSAARVTDQEGIMVLVFDDTIQAPSYAFFELQDQQSPEISIQGSEVAFSSPGATATVTKTLTFPFSTTNGQSLDSISLLAGQLAISAVSNMPANISLEISVPTLKISNADYQRTLTLNGPTSLSPTETLQNSLLDLTDGGTTTNTVSFTITAQITDTGTPLDNSHELTLSFGLVDLEFGGIFGDLGTVSTSLAADSIKVDIFENVYGGNFTLLSPMVRLDMFNSIGLPIEMDIANIASIKEGSPSRALSGTAVSSPLNPYMLAAPTYDQIGETIVTPIELNSENSNLADLISTLPEYLSYQFDLTLNPGNAEHQNFALSTSRLDVGVHLELPFHGQLSDFVLRKRLDFDGLGIDELNSTKIKLKTVNGTPLDVSVQVYFLDADGQVMETLFSDPQIIKSAPVDASGSSSGETVVEMQVSLTQERIDRINEAVFVDLEGTIFTAENGTVPVKIGIDDTFSISLGVSTKMKYNLK